MPLIPYIVHTLNGPEATLGGCSDEAYNFYMENTAHKIFEFSISAKWFIKYLQEEKINFDLVDTYALGIAENGHLLIPSAAITIDVYDVKAICSKFALNYDKLIDAYANHLKLL